MAAGSSQLGVSDLGGRPDFDRPPVQEVALGVYFHPIPVLDAVRLAQLWERWRDRYPVAEEQPPLPPLVPESFDQPTLSQVVFFGQTPSARVWYQSEGRDQLVQVQRDRLVHNWRRLSAEQPYPHYDNLLPQFQQDAADLWSFLADQGLEPPVVTQAEATYVNPIPLSQIGSDRLTARLIAPWSGEMSDSFLPEPEDVNLTLRFRIPGPEGMPTGRLYVSAAPWQWQNPESGRIEPAVLLQVFARGAPMGEGLEGALEFLDLGHDWIVRGFKSLTTPEMHKKWGLKGVNNDA